MVAGPIYVAGHLGLVGSAIWRELERRGLESVGRTRDELDLSRTDDVEKFIADVRPHAVIMAAAKVGGIAANATYPADFIAENLQIQLNLLNASVRYLVPKVLFLGSSCIYPRSANQPIREDSLLTGPLEATNDAYAIAKIAGIMQVQAIRRQHNLPYISAMPTNLFGPRDNFSLESSHVLPAMIRKFHDAKVGGNDAVSLWGTGTPRREFLHVDDMARATLFLLDEYDDPAPINVGTGKDVSISALAELVRRVVGFEGAIAWDMTRPDGTPRKLLDTTRINDLGWTSSIGLEEGIRSTYEWFLEHVGLDTRL